ncbi:MAG: hypothetical protein HOE80_00835 [Candidatus Magasanikbacteria bacterium]|jgi:hypothetical protein|nr:hypothetical protein [Candidatus Magasanikbacteria bacterium]MBT4071251.1 hypothetical protein [Candidatus Magasanikbacteria bacterium]
MVYKEGSFRIETELSGDIDSKKKELINYLKDGNEYNVLLSLEKGGFDIDDELRGEVKKVVIQELVDGSSFNVTQRALDIKGLFEVTGDIQLFVESRILTEMKDGNAFIVVNILKIKGLFEITEKIQDAAEFQVSKDLIDIDLGNVYELLSIKGLIKESKRKGLESEMKKVFELQVLKELEGGDVSDAMDMLRLDGLTMILDKIQIEKIIDNNGIKFLFRYINNFNKLNENGGLIKKMLEHGESETVFLNLEIIDNLEFLENDESRQEILKSLDLSFIVEHKRYELLNILLSNIPVEEAKKVFEVTLDEAEEEIKELIKLELYYQAGEYISSLDIIGLSISDELKEKCIEKRNIEVENRNSFGKKREDYDEKNVIREVLKFYGAEMLEVEVDNFIGGSNIEKVQSNRENREISFKDKVALFEETAHVEKMFKWMQVYLVRAIVSEMKHCISMDEKSENNVNRMPISYGKLSVDEIINNFTDEQLREYFFESSFLFLKTGSFPFGGEKWAKIADLASEMMQDDLSHIDKKILIDRIIQIKHNEENGNIFDKDKENIIVSESDGVFKKILDIKYNAENLQELYDNYREELGENHEGVVELKRMLKLLEEIKKKGLRAKGSE